MAKYLSSSPQADTGMQSAKDALECFLMQLLNCNGLSNEWLYCLYSFYTVIYVYVFVCPCTQYNRLEGIVYYIYRISNASGLDSI